MSLSEVQTMSYKPSPETEALKEASKMASERVQEALRRLQRKLVDDEVIPEELLPEEPPTHGHRGK